MSSEVFQSECDSGSDCNDIYEKTSLAALESFTSDDDMRDSAIYSDTEESELAVINSRANRKFLKRSQTQASRRSNTSTIESS